MSRLFGGAFVSWLAYGCAGSARAPEAHPTPVASTPALSTASSNGPHGAPYERAPYESPGGLWMPAQIPTQAETLRRLGLKLDPALLADPLSGVLGAIVNLGGCSASFVSSQGLIVTNHHCAIGALQYNSTPSENLLRDGFAASKDEPERWSGPSMHVYVTRAMRDVSDAARAALAGVTDDLARKRALEGFEKAVVADCEGRRVSQRSEKAEESEKAEKSENGEKGEKGEKGKRCVLRSFYGGLAYFLIETLELRDVRLVYAPPEGIGNFGGEIDNWRWPRHVGDFAFFRAYVGKDGLPAEHHADNVPFASRHFLRLANEPLRENDLVLVAGYPGRTSQLAVADAVEETVTWRYPRNLNMFDAYIRLIEDLGKRDPEAAIKGTGWLRGFSNYRTKNRGELEGLRRGDVLAKKRREEQELRAFVAAEPAREARYGAALDAIAHAYAERRRTREADTALEQELLMPRLLWAATLIVRLAEERRKPDAERDPDYQERRVPDLRDALAALDTRYDPKLDQAVLTLALERVLETPPAERTPALTIIAGKDPNRDAVRRAVTRLYAGTRLADSKYRLGLLEPARAGELTKSTDTMIRLAVALRPLMREVEERADRFDGQMLRDLPIYMSALLEKRKGQVAPDANGTLRVSYGVVRRPFGEQGSAFTRLAEVVGKNRGEPPFDAPRALLDAVAARRVGAYVAPELGDVPVNFLSNVQITNGNSGSATLDAEGKLTGLAFDGTYESVASDWAFLPETRSIHVDIRYVLWVLDAVARNEALLRELGVTPSVP